MNDHKHFLKLLDFTPAEIQQFLDTAADLKAKKKAGVPHRYLEGKNVALIFEKTSTRTRCAFEVAAQDLGMGSTYLGPTGSQIGVKESIADTARVLGRMYDGIAGVQRPDQRVPPHPDPGGFPHHPGALREAEEHQAGVPGGRPVQHGQFPDGGLRQNGDALRGLRPQGLHAGPEADRHLSDHRRGAGVHRGPHGSHQERRRAVHGRVGLHGRAGRGLAGADRRPGPLPGDKGSDGQRRAPVPLYALPARLSRPQDQGGERDGREVRPGGHGGHRRGVRVPGLHRL